MLFFFISLIVAFLVHRAWLYRTAIYMAILFGSIGGVSSYGNVDPRTPGSLQADLVPGIDLHHQHPFLSRPQNFFLTTSCRMCLSKVRSATSCFSFRFSSSKSRNRRSSLTPIPPYFRFQL